MVIDVSILDDFNDFYDPTIKRENIAAVADRIRIHHFDLRDGNAVRTLFHREKFDVIAHLAARAGVRPSIHHPQLYYDTNVMGTLHLLEAARTTGVERFIFASSSSVYGVSKDSAVLRRNAISRKRSVLMRRRKSPANFFARPTRIFIGCGSSRLRFFTVYGPRQRPDLAIHQFTKKIRAGEPIDQFGDGTTRRDYTYIDDIIQGVVASLDYDGPLFDIFNLGENDTVQLKDLIAAIENALGKKAKINQLARATGRCAAHLRRYFESAKAARLQSDYTAARGAAKILDWFQIAATVLIGPSQSGVLALRIARKG